MQQKVLFVFVCVSCMLEFSVLKADDVVVVGAGMAGVSAARTLLRNSNHNVILLEANPDRYGGRTWTTYDFLSDGSGFDMGAAWIHAASLSNPVYIIALKLGLPLYATNYFDANIWNVTGSQFSSDELRDGVNKTIEIIKAVNKAAEDYVEDISLYDAILREDLYDLYRDPMQLLVMSFAIEGFWGASVHNISAKFLDNGDEYHGPEFIVASGYQDVLSSIVNGEAGEPTLDIRLGQQVTSIGIDDVTEQALVTTATGDTYQADSVIVTVSLGVLKEGTITFSPPLPSEKENAIRDLGMGNYNKFAIEFSSVFWEENITMLGVAPDSEVQAGMMVDWVNLYPPTGLPALVTFMEGDVSHSSEELSDEQLLEIALGKLSIMYGADVVSNQTVVGYTRTRWHADPFARGSWSYGTLENSQGEWVRLSTPVCPALHFAGEHTAVGFYGNVDSGYVTGDRAAKEIIDNVCGR